MIGGVDGHRGGVRKNRRRRSPAAWTNVNASGCATCGVRDRKR